MARLIDPKTGTAVHVEGNLERRYRALGWSEKITKRSNKVDAPPAETPTEVELGDNAAEAEASEAPATRRNTRRTK